MVGGDALIFFLLGIAILAFFFVALTSEKWGAFGLGAMIVMLLLGIYWQDATQHETIVEFYKARLHGLGAWTTKVLTDPISNYFEIFRALLFLVICAGVFVPLIKLYQKARETLTIDVQKRLLKLDSSQSKASASENAATENKPTPENFQPENIAEDPEPDSWVEPPMDEATREQKIMEAAQVLGFPPFLTEEDWPLIKSRYLELIKMYHPDLAHLNTPEEKAILEEKAKRLNEAYSFLQQEFGAASEA